MKNLVTKQHILCTNIILVQPPFSTLLESATQKRFTLIYYTLKFQVTPFSRIFFRQQNLSLNIFQSYSFSVTLYLSQSP